MLTGTGKAFSAGVDTKAAATLDREGQHAGVEAINSLVTTLFGSAAAGCRGSERPRARRRADHPARL